MKIRADWLHDPALQGLMQAFSSNGHDIYAVGGCVRNTLMGLPISDIDLATSAPPEMITEIAKKAGFRTAPTGIDHGTITVLADSAAYEVTTFRKDIATDGRHAKVIFSHSIAEDAQRRDFTMNALYADPAGAVLDPVQGLPDVIERRVRFVGTPAARIAEDYLRILRFFRFSAVYGNPALGFDPEAMAACADLASGVDQLSKERVGQEMRKLLAARDPAPALASMAAVGVLMRVLQGAQTQFIAPLVHVEGGAARHWITRLAVLGGENARQPLRLSNAEAGRLLTLQTEMGGTLGPAALAWRFGLDLAGDILHARAALFGQALPSAWQADLQRGAAALCPVSAADFMPRLSGPDLGGALKAAITKWLQSDLQAGRADLLGE
jgi:poly(A) polymerase